MSQAAEAYGPPLAANRPRTGIPASSPSRTALQADQNRHLLSSSSSAGETLGSSFTAPRRPTASNAVLRNRGSSESSARSRLAPGLARCATAATIPRRTAEGTWRSEQPFYTRPNLGVRRPCQCRRQCPVKLDIGFETLHELFEHITRPALQGDGSGDERVTGFERGGLVQQQALGQPRPLAERAQQGG